MSLPKTPARMISESGTLFWSPADRLAKIAPGTGELRYTVWFMEHGYHRGFIDLNDLMQARAVASHFVLGQDAVSTHVHRAATQNENRLPLQSLSAEQQAASYNSELFLLAA